MQPNLFAASNKCPVLSKASSKSRDYLIQQSRMRRFERGETIFLHEDTAANCYILVNGWAKLYRIMPSGAEAVMRMHTSGETIGFADALRGGTYQTGADAASECIALEVPAAAIRATIAKDPEFGTILLTNSFEQIDALSEQIETLKCLSGMQRVAAFLLQHARKRQDRLIVTLPYEKGLMAAYLGIKPESLSRALSKLKTFGVIPAGEGLEITDPTAIDELIHSTMNELRKGA